MTLSNPHMTSGHGHNAGSEAFLAGAPPVTATHANRARKRSHLDNKHAVLTLTRPPRQTPDPLRPPPASTPPPEGSISRDHTASSGSQALLTRSLDGGRLLPSHSLTPDPPPSPGLADRQPLPPPALDADRRGVRGGSERWGCKGVI